MTITAAKFFAGSGALREPAVEDQFFTDLRTRNATFKRTARHRFEELDDVCIRTFREADARIAHVLDIGISSGSTTVTLSERLIAAGYAAQLVGTDIALDALLISPMPGVRVLTDEAGHALQFDVLGQAVRPWGRRADYATGMLVFRAALNAVLGGMARQRLQGGRDGVVPVRLISPSVDRHANVEIVNNDILQDTPAFHGRFDFIRAGNILNRGYFGEAALRDALRNIVRYLSGPGAWLLIARSTGGRHVGTLFRISSDGRYLDVVDRFGGGSEIEWLAIDTSLPGEWSK